MRAVKPRRRCVVVSTKFGPVRVQRIGDMTARDIQAIEELAECVARNKVDPLSVCPGCGCFRDRCACDLRETNWPTNEDQRCRHGIYFRDDCSACERDLQQADNEVM